jgi:folate-dependent phosphoribosylglycinamide formyltransferase PurN
LTIGWFSTGRDEAARQLLQVVHRKIQADEIEGTISFVFSNREPGEAEQSDLFFDQVQSYDIPLICFSSKKFEAIQHVTDKAEADTLPKWRLDYDRQIMERLEGFKQDLCVLAGYMLIVGKDMCRRYDMINLHPATPGGPKGSWQEVIWALMEDKASASGVMMHLVTPELDRGPVITYCTYPIRGEPFDTYWREIDNSSVAEIKREQGENNALFKLIRQHGLAREFPLIVSTLSAFSRGEVKIEAGTILDRSGKQTLGYDLTDKVNRALESR